MPSPSGYVAAQNDAFYSLERMPGHRHALRDRILARIRRGELATVREIMLVASVPRQTVNRWLREDKIDLAAMRLRHISKLHQVEEEYLETRSGQPRLTSQQRWIATRRAMRRFNEANAKEPGSARAGSSAAPEVERAKGVADQMPSLRTHGNGVHDPEAAAESEPEVL